MVRLSFIALALFSVQSVSGFVSQPVTASRSAVSVSMSSEPLDGGKKFAASVLTAAYLLGNVVTAAPAFAAFMDSPDFGSSQVIAAKSGGRSGGRASSGAGSAKSYSAPPVSSSRSNVQTNTITRTTIIERPVYSYSPPPVVVAPAPLAPSPGLGLGVGLAAASSIGNAMQDMRQEQEIQRSKEQLQEAKMREAQMEERLRQMEMAQMEQRMQLQMQMQRSQ